MKKEKFKTLSLLAVILFLITACEDGSWGWIEEPIPENKTVLIEDKLLDLEAVYNGDREPQDEVLYPVFQSRNIVFFRFLIEEAEIEFREKTIRDSIISESAIIEIEIEATRKWRTTENEWVDTLSVILRLEGKKFQELFSVEIL